MALIRFILLLSLSCFIFSCNEYAKDNDRGDVIMIDDIGSQKIRMSDVVEEVKVFKLETDSLLIGEIGDLCVYDSIMFFFDRLTWNLTTYDLQKQSVIRTINNRGNGPFEYVRPHALSIDKNNLFLLDSSTRKIICYNHYLEPENEIHLSFTASDFVKVSDGFLLCSVLPEPSLDFYKIIYVGMDGKMKDSYIHTHRYGMTLGKNFVQDENGDVYVSTPYSNQIYRWNNGSLHGYCYTDYGKFNIPEDDEIEDLSYYDTDYIHNNIFFVTSTYFINGFLYADRIHYHIRENVTGHSFCGIVEDEENGLPFFPRWQYGNNLIGQCRWEELSLQDSEFQGMDALTILFFTLKKNIQF